MPNELVKVAVLIYSYKGEDYVFVPELVPFYQNNLGAADDNRSIPEKVNDEERLKQAIAYATWPLNREDQFNPATSHLNQARLEVERRYQEMRQRPKPIVFPYSITEEWIDTYVRSDENSGVTIRKHETLPCIIADYQPSTWEKFFPPFAIALSILVTTGPVVALAVEFLAAASLGLIPILVTLGIIVGLWKLNYDDFDDRLKKISRDLERYYRRQYQHWGNFSLFRTGMSLLAALITGSTAQYIGWSAFEGTWEALISVRDVVQNLPRWAAWLLSPTTILAVAALTGIVVTVGVTISILYVVTGSWFGWGIRDPRYVLGEDTLPLPMSSPPLLETDFDGQVVGFMPLKELGTGTGANVGRAPSTAIPTGNPTYLDPGYQVMANVGNGEGPETERVPLLAN